MTNLQWQLQCQENYYCTCSNFELKYLQISQLLEILKTILSKMKRGYIYILMHSYHHYSIILEFYSQKCVKVLEILINVVIVYMVFKYFIT